MMKLAQIISAVGTTTMLTGCPFATCFIAGVRVVHIESVCHEQISVGDKVWSWDVVTHQAALRTVTHLVRGESTEVYRIEAGEFVISGVTGNHPIWSPSHGEWMDAAALRKGDPFFLTGCADAAEVPITAIGVRRLEHLWQSLPLHRGRSNLLC